ncbi:hypothetical protein G9A89_005765 [Geosiphon pyriformis]|nr:hypothetical protein G9A89_005765 [Geosiphon pyriformis]
MTNAKIEKATPSKILEIKNNSPEPVDIVLIPNPKTFLDIETGPEKFHKYYQNLALIREEQEQCLEQLNTRLYQYCLILCNFQYCNECDLIYNPPIHMIYMIPEKKEPISSCALELESNFNLNSDSNNDDDENNSFSFVPYGNNNNNNLDSDSNSNLNHEQYIALSDLTKEQELKWFSDNNEGIMPKHAYNTDAEFDLRYLRKNSIKLELYLCTCFNLKIALEILATTMVQLASKSSLAKKRINIKREIIDTKYIENIIAMLQNDSEKTYIIDPNKKIAQAIFLSLLVSVRNKEELGITTKEIQGFGSTGKIDIPVNMAEKEIINKKKIISTCQSISIPPYDQYIVVIERKVKNQVQIFEAETTLCQALGAVLSQKRPDGRKHPIAYVSRSLSSVKKNYGTPALEHLAIYWAVIK